MSDAASLNISRDTGGYDEDEDAVFPASFECHDCGLCYSWPVTPGLAPNDDPLQTEMLALVNAHTTAACRAAQASAAIEREKVLAAEADAEYAACEVRVQSLQVFEGWSVKELVTLEAAGAPAPISGDPMVTLQQAIERGAVTVTRGLPLAVAARRANPSLDGTYRPARWLTGTEDHGHAGASIWPAPSHHALTDSITALADQQRRLMIGGRLTPAR